MWREGRRHWWERLSIPWTRSLKDWSRFFREDLDLVGEGGGIVPPFSLSPIIDLSAHRRKACLEEEGVASESRGGDSRGYGLGQ